ncbi:hypothetical protein D2V17_05795, partial [Aurantiacibacter xanthus]
MTLAGLPLWAFALGALAIAGVLLLLQRLRPAPRTIVLPGAMLWAEAIRMAPARVLDRPLRHLWAYLLAVVLAGLLWTAFADPVRTGPDQGAMVTFYLDTGPGMGAGDGAPAT